MRLNQVLLLSAVIVVFASLPVGTMAQQRGIVVNSLNDMVLRSEVILEATVQSVFPSHATNVLPNGHATPGTDSLLRSTRVVKGSQPPTEFVVAQLGGTLPNQTGSVSSQLMQAGKRYVVFLKAASPSALRALPQRSVPRYEIVGGNIGLISIDEMGNARLDPELPFHGDYDRKPQEVIMSAITALVTGVARP